MGEWRPHIEPRSLCVDGQGPFPDAPETFIVQDTRDVLESQGTAPKPRGGGREGSISGRGVHGHLIFWKNAPIFASCLSTDLLLEETRRGNQVSIKGGWEPSAHAMRNSVGPGDSATAASPWDQRGVWLRGRGKARTGRTQILRPSIDPNEME